MDRTVMNLEDVVLRIVESDGERPARGVINYRSSEDIEANVTGHPRTFDLGVLTNLEEVALVALAAGLGELNYAKDAATVADAVDHLYEVVESLLRRTGCPDDARPVP